MAHRKFHRGGRRGRHRYKKQRYVKLPRGGYRL